ncbi:hypothetical protein TL16_g03770 [Triparma laevis f. inornata]|uniref:PX domain-containing protein n=1 Tax=Triparma laevis f. inornata TaxID=1714386 RepID=A0A9W7A687_9STRA|nr:hypothetical protein TL16_g03770 [Triparma laevis f. inornata]
MIGAVIPRSTLTPTGADGAGALFYEIHLRVSPPSNAKASGVVPLEYVVYHRYSEFLALHQALVGDGAGVEAKVREAATSVSKDLKDHLENTFPPKILIANTLEYMDDRMENLERWIHAVVDFFNVKGGEGGGVNNIVVFLELDLRHFQGDNEEVCVADYYVDANPQQQIDYWNYVESLRMKEREEELKKDKGLVCLVKQGSICACVNSLVLVALVKGGWLDFERLGVVVAWVLEQVALVCWGGGTCEAPAAGAAEREGEQEENQKVGVTSWEKRGAEFEFCFQDVKQIIMVLHVVMAVSMFVKDKLI